MQSVNLRAGQTSEPFSLGRGSIASLSGLTSSFSGYFEYTFNTYADIQNKTATWTTWPLGTVSVAASDMAMYQILARAVCLTGQIQATFGDAVFSLQQIAYPWADSIAMTTPSGAPAGIAFPGVAWANRPLPSSNYIGAYIRITDVGGNTGTGGGNLFFANATRWKPVGGNIILDAVDTSNSSVANTSEQNINPSHIVIPAGVIATTDRLRFRGSFSKSGASDTATLRLRFGPLGTTSDPVIATLTTLASTNQTLGVNLDFKVISQTSIQKIGNASTDQSYGGASAGAWPSAVTISDMSVNGMYLSITSQMTGGTETVMLQDMVFELYPTDSV